MTLDVNAYLTTEQLAARYGISPTSVKRWRTSTRKGKEQGPSWYEVSRLANAFGQPRIRYRLADVLAFEEANTITPIN
jgi:transposase-like protein